VPHPWDTGDLERNWQGYFIPGTRVLRNRVGARTLDELQNAENDLVEARLIELRETPGLMGDRSYDLRFIRAIHRQLFQDVYDWAGDDRTVGLEKGDESFCPPGSIDQPMAMSPRRFTASNNSRPFLRRSSRAPSRICTTA